MGKQTGYYSIFFYVFAMNALVFLAELYRVIKRWKKLIVLYVLIS